VVRIRRGVYQVPSQSEPGVRWTVIDQAALESGDGLQCVCPAGLVGKPCAHKSALIVRRQQEAKRRQRLAQAAAEVTTTQKENLAA